MPAPKISPIHDWVAATTVHIDGRQAKQGALRGSLRLRETTRIEVLEVYCNECRRPYDDVADEECVAATTREHLHGGPIGERAKRKHRYHDCEAEGCQTAANVARQQATAPGRARVS